MIGPAYFVRLWGESSGLLTFPLFRLSDRFTDSLGERPLVRPECVQCVFSLVPKLLFGNALRETPVSRPAPRGTRNRVSQTPVPKQEFGHEGRLGTRGTRVAPIPTPAEALPMSYPTLPQAAPPYPITASNSLILSVTSGTAFLPDASFFSRAVASARE
jgi:hypothetical protein